MRSARARFLFGQTEVVLFAFFSGRYDRLILDSWTRPKYASMLGRKRPISDQAIVRRFKRYGQYAGLAFWLFLTRDWLNEAQP